MKRFGLIDKLEKELKEIQNLLNTVEIEKKFYEPDNFIKNNCGVLCSESCDLKFNKSLNKFGQKVNRIYQRINDLKTDIFYYTDGKKYKDKNKNRLLFLIEKIDKYISEIEQITNRKAYEYNFNFNEIKARGDFYKGKLIDLKQQIQNAINNDNFYLYSKYINEGITSKTIDIFKEFKETFKELDKDYFIILKDKKVEYKAVFTIYSWDDYQDYPVEHSLTKEIKLSEELYKIIRSFFEETKGEKELCKGKVYSVKCYIGDTELKNIVSELLTQVSYGDTDYELYVEDIYPIYYHLYELVSSDGMKETKWVEVDKRTFDTFKEINTVIMAKPIGYFEDQIKVSPKEIYQSVVNNPYYVNAQNRDINTVIWIIRNRLPEVVLPDTRYPEDFKRSRRYDYYSSKNVLMDYAKKYGLDKEKLKVYREKRRTDEFLTGSSSGTGGTGLKI
ncbi:MAG: hypothetical protein DSY60_01025 [Persephonella sp.]|nr:MAG: hypothetical protein DSY60_01025 [Persephonella sp.]